MTVVLFQRVSSPAITPLSQRATSKPASLAEMRRSIADEMATIVETISEGKGTARLKIAIMAKRTGMTKRRVRALWYREAARIEACEADLLRRMAAAHAAGRIGRLERELELARAALVSNAA